MQRLTVDCPHQEWLDRWFPYSGPPAGHWRTATPWWPTKSHLLGGTEVAARWASGRPPEAGRL